MFCPHCGADSQKPAAYCTRCGTWLIDPSAVVRHGRRIPHSARSPEQKMRAVLVFNVIDTLLALGAFLAIMLSLRPNTPWQVVMLITSLVIAVHQAISFKFNLELRNRLKRGREAEQASGRGALAGQVGGRALGVGEATQFAPPLSVAEQTTELLERVPRERGERR